MTKIQPPVLHFAWCPKHGKFVGDPKTGGPGNAVVHSVYDEAKPLGQRQTECKNAVWVKYTAPKL
jgi:hypothetical protein